MPAHSSHLLQPLDVGCFATLKRGYGDLINRLMISNVDHIDKLDFLSTYPEARQKALISSSIQSGFIATGLVPYNPDRVLSTLNIRLKTPTPPPSRGSIYSSDLDPKTPQNHRQIQRQASSMKALLKTGSRSPPTPSQRILNQFVKGFEMKLQENLLLR